MSHLILGGTGTVGSAVLQGLLEHGEAVRVLTRSAEKIPSLPAGAEGVVGDLTDPDTYGEIFSNLDTLFLLNAVSMTELHEGLAALHEAKRAGVRRLVYLSVQSADQGVHIPHFAAKVAIENAIQESGIPYTILRPSNFYQNDLWFQQPIVEYGIYPQPLGDVGVSRVDVRDIAEAAVNALVSGDFVGRTFTLAGPEPLTGEACARAYAEALGREIRYAGNDLESWAEQSRQMLPGWMVWDFGVMYALFQEQGLIASADELREMEQIVGHPPRGFRAFAQEMAERWT